MNRSDGCPAQDRIADATAHQVCQGRSLGVAVDAVGREMGCADPAALRDRVAAVYKALTASIDAAAEGRAPHVLALIGDYPHPPAYIRSALISALGPTGLGLRFLYDVRQFGERALADARLLVVLRDGMLWPEPGGEPVWWLTDEQERALARFVESGGGYLALHNATALKHIDDTVCLYREVLGSSYSGHGPADEAFRVAVTRDGHPVTSGVNDYAAVDERHWPVMSADDADILLRAESRTGSSVNGYVRNYGRGRVCYLANGHTREMLSCDAMQRLIRNAALWLIDERDSGP